MTLGKPPKSWHTWTTLIRLRNDEQNIVTLITGKSGTKNTYLVHDTFACYHSQVLDRVFNGPFVEGQTRLIPSMASSSRLPSRLFKCGFTLKPCSPPVARSTDLTSIPLRSLVVVSCSPNSKTSSWTRLSQPIPTNTWRLPLLRGSTIMHLRIASSIALILTSVLILPRSKIWWYRWIELLFKGLKFRCRYGVQAWCSIFLWRIYLQDPLGNLRTRSYCSGRVTRFRKRLCSKR